MELKLNSLILWTGYLFSLSNRLDKFTPGGKESKPLLPSVFQNSYRGLPNCINHTVTQCNQFVLCSKKTSLQYMYNVHEK